MDLSNRSLTILVSVTMLLVVGAVGLSLLPTGDGEPDPSTLSKEIVVAPTVQRRGGTQIEHNGSLEVRPEPGTTATTATLVCDTYKSQRPFLEGMAEYPSLPLGQCSVALDSASTPYEPVFPGDRLLCSNIEGATHCTGGLASKKAASVSVASALPGVLEIDGEPYGKLPLQNLRVKIGVRKLSVKLEDGRSLEWSLVVNPEQTISVEFPDPAAAGSAARMEADLP